MIGNPQKSLRTISIKADIANMFTNYGIDTSMTFYSMSFRSTAGGFNILFVAKDLLLWLSYVLQS